MKLEINSLFIKAFIWTFILGWAIVKDMSGFVPTWFVVYVPLIYVVIDKWVDYFLVQFLNLDEGMAERVRDRLREMGVEIEEEEDDKDD